MNSVTVHTAEALPLQPSNLDQDRLFRRITHRIRQSLELQEILNATVTEVQQFLGVDRVKIYKFHPDMSGQVIAEYLTSDRRLPSLHGLNFPADDIPPHARQLFIEAKVRNVVDVTAGLIGQSRLCDPDTGEVVAADWAFRPLDPCHQEYLTAMGVQASLAAPIFHHDQLWGLLVVHHASPMEIPFRDLTAIQLVVDQLAVAIGQSAHLQAVREKAAQKATINQIAVLLNSLTTIDLQAALAEAVATFQGSGGRLLLRPESLQIQLGNSPTAVCARAYTVGSQPVMTGLRLNNLDQCQTFENCYGIQSHFQSPDDRVWAIDDIYQISELRTIQSAFRTTAIRGLLLVPLMVRQQIIGYLSIFRDEFVSDTLWAGHCAQDQRQLLPRQSFDVWRQSQIGQIRPWSAAEMNLAQALADQFATAIEQYELYQQVHALNDNLETQVRTRTAELQQVTEQQKMLFEVVTKMRQSLALDQILTTVTQEVRRILHADRVGVYYFDPAANFNDGVFIAEATLPAFPAAMTVIVHDHCFGQDYAEYYRQGRISALADITQAGLQDCYRVVLEQFAIKASLVAPILKGDQLWGLFCVHHCDQPYDWKEAEIDFVRQVSAQVSIAIEQADLLTQQAQQAQHLTATIKELQATQTQLIQTEKMSSLGQLVAGVAHEINNPVNFIHGNLAHVSNYIQALLSLVDLYQTRYGQSDPEIQTLIEDVDLEFIVEDLQKVLSSMDIGTQRIRNIVLSLRNFSRLDQAEMKPVDIHEGVDSTLMILSHRLKANGDFPEIQVVKQYAELPLVECYASQLNQVFMNVLANAIDAVEQHNAQRSLAEIYANPSIIKISTQLCGEDSIKIVIADNGAGMTEPVRAKIFDPFYTTKPVGKGTGLGLSISYQIVTEKHHGQLYCHSQIDQGTEFVIQIPIRSTIAAERHD
jgi:light-regulated signal transduction histidine kinase (bacteriophytochrome)